MKDKPFDYNKANIVQKDFAETMFDGMQTPEESLGISSEEYNKIVEECIYGEEEPVSEDLEEAADEYANSIAQFEAQRIYSKDDFIAGANWREEQFEKNRLSACDSQTEDEAQREIDFAMNIIKKEHRQPTYSDAIEYGMRVQKEQMMEDAIDGVVICDEKLTGGYRDIVFNCPDEWEAGDRVIIIKEADK